MNILLAGSSGQLGQELLPQLQRLGQVFRVDQVAKPGDSETLEQDLCEPARLEALLDRIRPDIVVNAAAYTAVDLAEDHPAAAFRINTLLPECLARWSERHGSFLLHYSTDYVFSGNAARPYTEQDPTGPLGVYGKSKLAGEWLIAASKCRHVILRTSWVYSGRGNNFVLTMLRLAHERPSLDIVSDQVGCPTWARNLAEVSRKVIEHVSSDVNDTGRYGLFHYCDGQAVSWYEFALAVFRLAKQAGILRQEPQVQAVRSSDFPQKAARPLNSVLDTSKIHEVFGIETAGLERALKSCLDELVVNE